jgi:hypothetical protein
VPARDITVAVLADDERIDPTEVAARCCTRPLGTGADLVPNCSAKDRK